MVGSPTQRVLEPDQVADLVAASFGPQVRVLACAPMTGGSFAAVWSVRLSDGQALVLKVGPSPETPLLGYERGLLAAEARYYRLAAAKAPDVPLPRVVDHRSDPRVFDSDWLFMTRLPGRNLAEWAEAAAAAPDSAADPAVSARRCLGAALASLHAVTGERFGYDGERVSAAAWRPAFTGIIEELLADAAAWRVELPVPGEEIRRLVACHGDLLDRVERPALLHFDTWDGNLLVEPRPDGGLRLTGLVDGERHLYGDPVMDFVSPALFRCIEQEPEHPFRLGYQDATGVRLEVDDSVRRRLGLYRLHLYLLMLTELPSRGASRQRKPQRYAFLADLLTQQVAALASR